MVSHVQLPSPFNVFPLSGLARPIKSFSTESRLNQLIQPTPELYDPIIGPQRHTKGSATILKPTKFIPGPKDTSWSTNDTMKPVELTPNTPSKPFRSHATGLAPELIGDADLPHGFALPKLKATKRPSQQPLHDRCDRCSVISLLTSIFFSSFVFCLSVPFFIYVF